MKAILTLTSLALVLGSSAPLCLANEQVERLQTSSYTLKTSLASLKRQSASLTLRLDMARRQQAEQLALNQTLRTQQDQKLAERSQLAKEVLAAVTLR